jgi:RHH-type proline utilization regulon transcriptional repressor/proline dehydrogenase/delta 1-pyrroline-5-carboxylate dehydrogenase
MAQRTPGDATVAATPAQAGPSSSAVEARLREAASELLAAHPRPLRTPARAAENRAMGALAERPAVRAALFRLVDVAPACRNDSELAEHLLALISEVDPARGDGALGRLGRLPGARRLLARGAARGIRRMARRFIVAETPSEAVPALQALWGTGVAASLDLLGERTVTSAEADRYAQRCLAAIRDLGAATSAWPKRPHLERDDAGELPRANLSVKVTALTPALRPHAPGRGISDARPRLRELLRVAREEGAHLHIDMESFDSRDAVLELALELLAEPEFAHGPSAGVVLQAYLADAEPQLARMLDWARTVDREPPLTVRLVKGAYWDHEVIESGLRGWAPPVLAHKQETDRSFEALTRRLIDARELVRTAIGSHNIRSVAYALAYCDQVGAGEHAVEFQILRGLGEEMQAALAAHRLRVRAYCPVGDLVAGMAYLVRRLLENSSNDSFLVQRALGRDLEALIAPPGPQGVEP